MGGMFECDSPIKNKNETKSILINKNPHNEWQRKMKCGCMLIFMQQTLEYISLKGKKYNSWVYNTGIIQSKLPICM
jgi:hypothetical protein